MGDEYSNEDELGHIQEHHGWFCSIARTAHTNAMNTFVEMDYCENIAQERARGAEYAHSTHSDHHLSTKSSDAGNAHGIIWVTSCRFSLWAIRQPCVAQRSSRRRYCIAVTMSRNPQVLELDIALLHFTLVIWLNDITIGSRNHC